MKRPWICAECNCEPIFQGKASDYDDISVCNAGQSWICFGKMKQSITFMYNGVEHENDLRTCQYTTLKGLVAWQMNEADWDFFATVYGRAFEKIQEMRAAELNKLKEGGEGR
jgi:hypothetical protein